MIADLKRAKVALSLNTLENLSIVTGISLGSLKKFSADPKTLENAKWSTVKKLSEVVSSQDYQLEKLKVGDFRQSEVPFDYFQTLFDGARHFSSFMAIYRRMQEYQRDSVYWLSAIYILSWSETLTKKIDSIIQFESIPDPEEPEYSLPSGLRIDDFPRIASGLSTGETEMVLVAFNLYNGFDGKEGSQPRPFVDDVFGRDRFLSDVYIKAIQIRFTWYMNGSDYKNAFDSYIN